MRKNTIVYTTCYPYCFISICYMAIGIGGLLYEDKIKIY